MYAWIWRNLPGPTWLRALQAALYVIGILLLLFGVVFPWWESSAFLSGVDV